VRLEDTDYILFVDEEERAETALEKYLEERNGKKEDASGSYRYFVTGEETLTIIEDIRIGDEHIYNIGVYGEEMKIERNVDYGEVKDLLGDH
jgi:hypothetical protein